MQDSALTITIRVLLFAAYRETVGEKEIQLEAPTGSTPDDVYRALEDQHPALTRLRNYTTFAVNRAVRPSDTPLADGDEVALLQPVSGGDCD
jgi:molybdopterin synthase catalytic subunit